MSSNRYRSNRYDIQDHYNEGNTDESDWESSFAKILSRTKQNINQVNEKYMNINSNTGSYDNYTIPFHIDNHDSPSRRKEHPYPQKSAFLLQNNETYKRSKSQSNTPIKSPRRENDNYEVDENFMHYHKNGMNHNPNKEKVQSPSLEKLLERIMTLESNLSVDNTNEKEGKIDMLELERRMTIMEHKVDNVTLEIKRHDSDFTSKISSQGALLESIQQEIDSRRSLLSKVVVIYLTHVYICSHMYIHAYIYQNT